MSNLCVIGVGADTPLGADAAATSAACRAAISSIAEHPVYVDARGERVFVSRSPRLGATLAWSARIVAMAQAAVQNAMTGLGNADTRQTRDVDVLVALPEPRPGTVNEVERELTAAIAEAVAPDLKVSDIRFAWQGHAGGLLLVRYA